MKVVVVVRRTAVLAWCSSGGVVGAPRSGADQIWCPRPLGSARTLLLPTSFEARR
jgi:hypothetical protein